MQNYSSKYLCAMSHDCVTEVCHCCSHEPMSVEPICVYKECIVKKVHFLKKHCLKFAAFRVKYVKSNNAVVITDDKIYGKIHRLPEIRAGGVLTYTEGI